MKPIITVLERSIAAAHNIRVFGRPYHPYFVATDAAALISVSLTFLMTRQVSFVAIFLSLVGLYGGFLWVKRNVLKVQARSFLQDTVLFILPSYSLICFALGFSQRFSFDLAGIIFPVYGSIVRIGCFFGGCCYGLNWEHGVAYPDTIFAPAAGLRTFRSGPNPGGRVLPTQLIESAGLVVISASLYAFAWNAARPSGRLMPEFLMGYSALRFLLDFFRRVSARPRIGRFSEAQVFSVAVFVVSLTIWSLAAMSSES